MGAAVATSEEGRAQERDRRATLTTVTTVVARALEAALTLVSVPLTLGYLGKEHYGLWMAISSLLAWATLADFGLLRGLQNRLSEAHGRDDRDDARRAMATAFHALSALALGGGGLFALSLWLVPWADLLRISDPGLRAELTPALAATVAVFLLQFPLRTVRQAYAAYHRGHVANLFSIVGSAASLAALLAVIKLRLGLPWLILASGGVSLGVGLLNLAFLARDLPFLWPDPSAVSGPVLRALARVSAPMLCFELGSLLINETQMVILARERGVASVADYVVYLKVMSVPLFLVNALDAPYVPMYREALIRGDHGWFRQKFSQLQRAKLTASLGLMAVLVVSGDALAGLLSGQSVRFGAATWALAGLSMVVGCWNGTYNNLFFAIERLWTLVLIILANSAVTLGLTLWLAGPHGLPGVLVAGTAFSLLVSGWLLPLLSRGALRGGAQDRSHSSASAAAVEATVTGSPTRV